MPRATITDDIRAQALRLLNMGWTIRMIADELHIGKTTVSKIGAAAGVTSRYKGGCFLTEPQLNTLRESSVLHRHRHDLRNFTKRKG